MNTGGGQKRLAIIDPGLMRASGHHAALAEVITSGTLGQNWQVDYICHRMVSEDIRAALEEYGCRVQASFDINFYENFNQQRGMGDIQPYLRQAAEEYRAALEFVTQADDEVICFYPSINWDHAMALSLVLAQWQKEARPVHRQLCCAMFNPGVDHHGHALDMQLELNAGIAFKALAACPGVEIQASDGELSRKYARLLQRPVPVHPCYLTDWRKLPTVEEREVEDAGTPIRITLYLGEAKADKGFCRLPSLVRHLLNEVNRELKIYIQYTLVWPDAKVEKVGDELKALASKEPRLILERDFLSDEQFHQRLQASDIMVFTYEKAEYGQKNSGILYFMAWYGIPTLFLVDTWLNREARRLSLPQIQVCEGITLADAVNTMPGKTTDGIPTVSDYRQQIYQPFDQWLNERTTQADNEHHAAIH